MTDLRQSADYAAYLTKQGWLVEKVNSAYVFIRKIPLTPFSIIKIQRPEKIPFTNINRLVKKYRTIKIYLEPLNNKQTVAARKHGFHQTKSNFLPTKTLIINLTQSEKKILLQMKKDTRYALRQTAPLIHQPPNLTDFHHVWKKSIGLKRWTPSLKSLQSLKKTFGHRVFFLATSPITAGTIILFTNRQAYYYQAFTSTTGRQELAQYHLVWQAIKLAKKRGCKTFDFEGIYDDRFPNKSWLGFTHFKKSFGGHEAIYPGCFTKISLKICLQ